MLKITRQTDYGVMILTRFAQEGIGRIHNAREPYSRRRGCG